MTKRRTAPEIIGFHFGWDMREVSDARYHPTRIASPAVYVIGDDYYAAPSDNRPPRHKVGKPWAEFAEHYGRKIFISECEKAA
jgi:hypothetical protein